MTVVVDYGVSTQLLFPSGPISISFVLNPEPDSACVELPESLLVTTMTSSGEAAAKVLCGVRVRSKGNKDANWIGLCIMNICRYVKIYITTDKYVKI